MARKKNREPMPPGTVTRRFRPKFHYELIVCGMRGHVLVGTDAVEVRPQDSPFVREFGDRRWYRCLRCDAWVPLTPPVRTKRPYVPDQDEIELPIRGRALRDKIVLRVIAVDRAIHFVVLGALAVLLFVLASHRGRIDGLINRLNSFFFGSKPGAHPPAHGFVHETERLLTLDVNTYRLIGAGAAAYALLEGIEAYGLWLQRRWAEYLTFIATTLFLAPELYELSEKITVFRVGTLVLNVVILVYLLFAKRLFGLRGGAEAEHAARERDSGWEFFDQLTPGGFAE